MTPVPLDLPLRPAEATELANLIFDHAERKPLPDELRNRLAARAAVLKPQTVTPFFGSLERDPVHPSAYYLAVDGETPPPALPRARHRAHQQHLLQAAPHRPHAPPQRAGDGDQRHSLRLPPTAKTSRPSPRASIPPSIRSPREPAPPSPWKTIPPPRSTFFRAIQKRTGKNLAAFAGDYHAAMWAAIRAGWRRRLHHRRTIRLDSTPMPPTAAIASRSPDHRGRRADRRKPHEQIRRVRAAASRSPAPSISNWYSPAPSPRTPLRAALEYCLRGARPRPAIGLRPDRSPRSTSTDGRHAHSSRSPSAFPTAASPPTAVRADCRATAEGSDYRVRERRRG